MEEFPRDFFRDFLCARHTFGSPGVQLHESQAYNLMK
jgi:hypothetical protein